MSFGLRLRSAQTTSWAALLVLGMTLGSLAQQQAPSTSPATVFAADGVGNLTGRLLEVPINTITPGAVQVRPQIKPPDAGDAMAAVRGMKAFASFNCVGCHMPNGGGGMGPALSQGNLIYGSEPANIYLSIVQGRPRGMPAWGSVLPEQVVWDLVAYIGNLKDDPNPQWGRTISPSSPDIQQVPAQASFTPTPWRETQPFTFGQRP